VEAAAVEAAAVEAAAVEAVQHTRVLSIRAHRRRPGVGSLGSRVAC